MSALNTSSALVAGGEDLTQLVSSLRRQNEDLRSKLNKEKNGQNDSSSASTSLQALCQQESTELRHTITSLERLLELEREEREQQEKKTLSLLTEVKKKWQDREEERVEKILREKEAAESDADRAREKARRAEERLQAEREEHERVAEHKQGLKAKLKECKAKLEATVASYNEAARKLKEAERGAKGKIMDNEDEIKRREDELKSLQSRLAKVEEMAAKEAAAADAEREKRSGGEREKRKLERACNDAVGEMKATCEALKAKAKKMEEENQKLKADLEEIEKDNEKNKNEVKQKERKIRDIQSVLTTLENKKKMVEDKENEENNKRKSAPVTCDKCDDMKSELSLQKVDIRLGEKKIKELEERVKFLREIMIREEREAKEKLAAELKEAKEKLDHIEDNDAELKTQKESFEATRKRLQERLDASEETVRELRKAKVNSEELQVKLDRAIRQLDSSEESLKDASKLKSNYETLKHTCMELQDQLADYEIVVSKQEKALEDAKVKEERLRTENDKMSESLGQLRVEKNEVKSRLIFTETQLKEVSSKHEDVETMFKREEESWTSRLEKVSSAKSEQTEAFLKVKEQLASVAANYDVVNEEARVLREQNIRLKEESSAQVTNIQTLKESNLKLHGVMEQTLAKIVKRNEEIKSERELRSADNKEAERKEHEYSVQLNQLRKLVEHLQAKVDALEGKGGKKGSSSNVPKSARKVAHSYEDLIMQLERERSKVRSLTEELQKHREGKKEPTVATPAQPPLREKAAKDLASKNPLAETGHAIPHRFHRQTNMKVQKCSVCLGSIPLFSTSCTCRFCHRVVHPTCEKNVGQDCGLSSDLALLLKTNNSHSQGVQHKGFLKVPPKNGGKEWKTVGVQITKDKLVIEGEPRGIHLNPDTGFVFIQSTVAYSELLHSSAYDQPHIFKIGYSSGSNIKDVHYFMAKTFQEKAAWIDAIEKVTLTLTGAESNNGVHATPSKTPQVKQTVFSPTKAMANWTQLTEFSEEASQAHIFCALQMTGNDVIFGTSSGIYRTSGAGDEAQLLERGPESVFQMALVEDLNEVVAIAGADRKLVVMREDDLERAFREPHRKIAISPVDCIESCHLFGVGYFNGDVFLCVIDDCRVSLLVRNDDDGRYALRYAFSTDQPTSCIHFTQSSVLVVTNKVYEIQLSDFHVKEFLNEGLARQMGSNDNYLVGLFQLNEEEFLVCFQDYGLFVNRFGERSRPDLRWSVSGQFSVAAGGKQLWLTYYNAVEAIDLEARQTIEMIQCKNPQILATNEKRIYFVDRRSPDNVMVMARR